MNNGEESSASTVVKQQYLSGFDCITPWNQYLVVSFLIGLSWVNISLFGVDKITLSSLCLYVTDISNYGFLTRRVAKSTQW